MDAQEYSDALETSWVGGLCSWCSPTLSSQPSHCLWTPYTQGMVAGSFTHPPCSSSQCFLNFYLMQGEETTHVSKGRSPWGNELLGRWQALPVSPRVVCRPSWAVEEHL